MKISSTVNSFFPFEFPGKKPLIGSNVRPNSASVPLFPCVNALPSKDTASLCIYCVRRWVLPFFLPSSWIYKSCLLFVSLLRTMRLVVAKEWDWVSERERKQVWRGLVVRCWRARCLRELRITCGFVRVWKEEASTSVFHMTIKRTFIAYWDPQSLLSLIFLSNLILNTVECVALWIFVFFLAVWFDVNAVWCVCFIFFLFLPLSVWKCDLLLVIVCVESTGGAWRSDVQVNSCVLRGCSGERLTSPYWKFEVFLNAFYMFCESKGILK